MPAKPHHARSAPAFPAPVAERAIRLADEAATHAFGLRFAAAIEAVRAEFTARHAFSGLQIQLVGELGAGKTTLVRAVLRGLGHTGRVKSPTYTLVEPYALKRPDGELELYHFDLYRFSDPAEWADAGFREYFNSHAICVVEWPQQAGALLGVPDLIFSLDVDGEGRTLAARAYSASGKACLERC